MDDSLLPLTKFDIGKPLKASNDVLPLNHPDIPYPRGMVSSPKIDGNRGMAICGRLLSSSGKEPRNERFHRRFAALRGFVAKYDIMLDYEVYAPSLAHHAELSGVLNSYDQPLPDDLALYVFDGCFRNQYLNQCQDTPFRQRIDMYHSFVVALDDPSVRAVTQRRVCDAQHASDLFNQDIANGLEGSMLRALDIWAGQRGPCGGWYKHGRATNKQGIIYKAKLYATHDGRITEVVQRRELKPDYPRERNEFGDLKGTYPNDAYTLIEEAGAFRVEYDDPKTGQTQSCLLGWGKGFPRLDRVGFWRERDNLLGKWVEFSHMPHGAASGGKARHGRLIRFREDLEGQSQ